MIKKQDQRLSDLKKLMQRELKIAPPPSDDDLTTTHSVPGQSVMSGKSLSHVRNSSSVSMDSVSVAGIHVPATQAETVSPLSQSGASVASVRNGGAAAAGIHKSATCQADLMSPATLSISDQHTVNGQYTPTNYDLSRSVRGQRSRSQAGVVMSPTDCEYDFVRELNFKYLRHVVLKFMLSREAEVTLLVTYVIVKIIYTKAQYYKYYWR